MVGYSKNYGVYALTDCDLILALPSQCNHFGGRIRPFFDIPVWIGSVLSHGLRVVAQELCCEVRCGVHDVKVDGGFVGDEER